MSLKRFVYYSAVMGGWAAYLAWLLAEMLLFSRSTLGGTWQAVLAAAVVGAALGAALNLVSGMASAQWRGQLKRIIPGLIGGGLGGAAGGWLGAVLYAKMGIPRAIGWLIMGAGIGAADGVYDKSMRKTRNGLIGGSVGGLLGGALFDPIASAGSDIASRVTAFVILGLAIGAMIGLAHVVFKEAWLTVVDGYRPGRQLILSSQVTALGRGDHLALPFLGYSGRDLEAEHARISRKPDGRFVCEDNRSRIGTKVNNRPIQGGVTLNDGDLIRLGTNIIRFNHRRRDASRDDIPIRGVETPAGSGRISAPPPAGHAPPPLPPELPRPAAPSASPSSHSETSTKPTTPSTSRIPPPPPPPG